MNGSDKLYTFLGIILIIGLIGWISNVVWVFHQTSLAKIALGILGAIVAPIGAIHGLFCL